MEETHLRRCLLTRMMRTRKRLVVTPRRPMVVSRTALTVCSYRNKKNCRNLPLAVKLNLYNLTRTNYQHNVASVPGIVMMVIMTADVSGYLSACDLNAPLLLKVRGSSGAGEIPLCPDNCHQAVSPDTG